MLRQENECGLFSVITQEGDGGRGTGDERGVGYECDVERDGRGPGPNFSANNSLELEQESSILTAVSSPGGTGDTLH